MPDTSIKRLQRTLGTPACRRLLERLRKRIERGQPLTGRLTLANPSDAERTEIEALLGRPPGTGSSLSVSLDELTAQIHSSHLADSLDEAVSALLGPVQNRKIEEAHDQACWDAILADYDRPEGPLPSEFLAALRASGRLKRLGAPDRARQRLDQLKKLALNLPARGEPIAQLAARLFGDSHALDPGQPLANLTLRLIHHVFQPAEDYEASRADRRRDTWASAGVLCDALSAPPIILNLPSTANHFLGDLLRRAAAIGEPVHVTLRQLLKYPLFPDSALCDTTVYVCENPTITALAADALGPRSHPLLCINGEPATPARTLLRQLREAGADICYHGDFDWRGVQIAGRVFRYCGARPWRFDTAAYQSAPKQKALSGIPSETPWDPALSIAMKTHAKTVHEEAVVHTLLEDLKQ